MISRTQFPQHMFSTRNKKNVNFRANLGWISGFWPFVCGQVIKFDNSTILIVEKRDQLPGYKHTTYYRMLIIENNFKQIEQSSTWLVGICLGQGLDLANLPSYTIKWILLYVMILPMHRVYMCQWQTERLTRLTSNVYFLTVGISKMPWLIY